MVLTACPSVARDAGICATTVMECVTATKAGTARDVRRNVGDTALHVLNNRDAMSAMMATMEKIVRCHVAVDVWTGNAIR